MSLPTGAVLAPGEFERIAKAVKSYEEALDNPTKFPHPERELSVKVVLHAHREYPKLLYKGEGISQSVTVNTPEAEQSFRDQGYGDHVPEKAKEE